MKTNRTFVELDGDERSAFASAIGYCTSTSSHLPLGVGLLFEPPSDLSVEVSCGNPKASRTTGEVYLPNTGFYINQFIDHVRRVVSEVLNDQDFDPRVFRSNLRKSPPGENKNGEYRGIRQAVIQNLSANKSATSSEYDLHAGVSQ